MGFVVESRNHILDDIFGKQIGDTLYEGLVDSQDCNSFNTKLTAIKEKWRNLEIH